MFERECKKEAAAACQIVTLLQVVEVLRKAAQQKAHNQHVTHHEKHRGTRFFPFHTLTKPKKTNPPPCTRARDETETQLNLSYQHMIMINS